MEEAQAPQSDDGDTEYADGKFRLLVDAMSLVAEEPIILARHYWGAPERFPLLSHSCPEDQFNRRVDSVVEHLGGPPRFFLLEEGEAAPLADNYPEAAMREVFAVFERARTSVCRADIFRMGSALLAAHPAPLHDSTPERLAVLRSKTSAAFWEHAEAAYIRLSSYWDRVGQLLDFGFFNIRKFDQNGFTAVMDRIHSNAAPMNDMLKNSGAWKKLRAFQGSEKEDGLKWLIQRRNLIVHSLHLHPAPTETDNLFKSQFNHLEAAHRERLRPKEPMDEAELLVAQLARASELFECVLSVALHAPNREKRYR